MGNKTLLQYLQEKHMVSQAMCNGNHSCGQCKVKVLNRDIELFDKERELLSDKEIDDHVVLACFHDCQDNDQIVSLNSKMDILDDLSLYNSFQDEGIGLIVDIGTTTIVMKWIDRSNGNTIDSVSFVNPQVTFGGDVISRINYNNECDKNVLHQVLVDALEKYLIEKNIVVNQMIICGNTTMIHFLLNEDVSPLGVAPFKVPISDMQRISSKKIFKNYNVDCEFITFPHISAYVGGDIVAGIYACDMDIADENVLFVDLGTNGEMAVGNKNGLLVTSTAAGPAFEGVGISCGGSSIPGAISQVKLHPMSIDTIDYKDPICICGSGLVSLLAELVRYEYITPIGKIINGNSIPLTRDICINQNDISQFQLAKAAIQTGVSVLLDNYPTDTIYVAGGFGSHINIDDLKTIHVIPQAISNTKSLGNSALQGCYKLLMTQDFDRVNHIVDMAKHINLADYDDFDDLLIESLYFYD